jgi:hypothetical protein
MCASGQAATQQLRASRKAPDESLPSAALGLSRSSRGSRAVISVLSKESRDSLLDQEIPPTLMVLVRGNPGTGSFRGRDRKHEVSTRIYRAVSGPGTLPAARRSYFPGPSFPRRRRTDVAVRRCGLPSPPLARCMVQHRAVSHNLMMTVTRAHLRL